jgi:hypothetical protein
MMLAHTASNQFKAAPPPIQAASIQNQQLSAVPLLSNPQPLKAAPQDHPRPHITKASPCINPGHKDPICSQQPYLRERWRRERNTSCCKPKRKTEMKVKKDEKRKSQEKEEKRTRAELKKKEETGRTGKE